MININYDKICLHFFWLEINNCQIDACVVWCFILYYSSLEWGYYRNKLLTKFYTVLCSS